jgi:plastocyanin
MSMRTYKRWVTVPGLVVVVIFAAVSCGGSASQAKTVQQGADPSVTEVTIRGVDYQTPKLTIAAGQTVQWHNDDPVEHTVTTGVPGKSGVPGVSEDTEPKPDGLIDATLSNRGSVFDFTFDDPGTYRYFCRVHPAMTGVVVVE